MRSAVSFTLTSLAAWTLAACAPAATPTGTPFIPSPMPGTREPTIVATVVQPTLTPIAIQAMTAPLYYLNPTDNQLYRVERDGTTTTRITNEAAPVTSFAVSPANGELAYTINNALIRTDALGGNRTVLVAGQPVDLKQDGVRFTGQIVNPQWSADGRTLAYAQNGILLIAAEGGEPRRLFTNTAFPDINNFDFNQPVHFYEPHSFSPNGRWLLVTRIFFPEGAQQQLVLLNSDAEPMTLVDDQGFNLCCNITWGSDGETLYVSNPYPGMFESGLWRGSTSDGILRQIIKGYTGDPAQPFTNTETLNFIGGAQEVDGVIYALAHSQPASDDIFSQPPALRLAQIAADGAITYLRGDGYPYSQVWLAPDGSGAVVTVPVSNAPGAHRVLWLAANGSPALELPIPADYNVAAPVIQWGR